MKILVTGAAGFVGSHFVEYLLNTTDWEIVCLVRMSRAGNLNRIWDFMNEDFEKRVKVVRHDLLDTMASIHRHIGEVDYIVHMAADSHVDDSIKRPREVFINNSVSSINILDYARNYQPNLKKFIYYSTDEVFGDVETNRDCKENDVLNPKNPYSAGKASGEMIANAYRETYGLPILIMRTMNMFGERQDPEKFVPKIVGHITRNEYVPIHFFKDKGKQRIGSRHWLYAKNSASAVMFMLEQKKTINKINIAGEIELNNLEIAQKVAKIMNKRLEYIMVRALDVRPGYDRRYSVDDSLIKSLGWKPPFNFENALEQTVKFSIKNQEWVL